MVLERAPIDHLAGRLTNHHPNEWLLGWAAVEIKAPQAEQDRAARIDHPAGRDGRLLRADARAEQASAAWCSWRCWSALASQLGDMPPILFASSAPVPGGDVCPSPNSKRSRSSVWIQIETMLRDMSCWRARLWNVSPEKSSRATWRLNSMLRMRCRAMGFHSSKPQLPSSAVTLSAFTGRTPAPSPGPHRQCQSPTAACAPH